MSKIFKPAKMEAVKSVTEQVNKLVLKERKRMLFREFSIRRLHTKRTGRRGKCCVNSIKTNLPGENYGMSTRDIQEQIKDLYSIDISSELVSKISEKILPEVNEWQNRPLEEYYPFIFMDAIHYKLRENHQIITELFKRGYGVICRLLHFL